MSKHKIGDIVQLQSGGPKMTVSSATAEGYCNCSWFKGDERHEDQFHENSLIPYESKTPPYAGKMA